MTDQMTTPIVIVAALLPLVAAVAIQLGRTQAAAHALNRVCAVTAALTGYVAAVLMVVEPSRTTWIMADPVAGIYVAVVSSVALASALISPAYLQHAGESFFAGRRVHSYYFALYAFWSGLVLIPVIANLGMAWLVVESTTAASAVLVAYSGKARALEAGWKYLMLTTLGLSLAFLGIVIMFASAKHGDQLRILNWSDLGGTLGRMPHGAALTAYALVVLGLAAKIGWAPVHNWLPDAHSEAPAPVSAMLSSALLPAVMLLLWRLRDAAIEPLGRAAATTPLAVFGLVSVAVAVPFLWQPLAWKRLLAYSSLEHMGILALGIAFASPLALAGVVLHVAGHAVSKSLGFYAALPLYEIQPHAAQHPARGIAASSKVTFVAMAVSVVTLAGLPPGPLFFSELFIVLGGIESHHVVLAAALAGLLALAFIGLLSALLEAVHGTQADAQQPVHREPMLHHDLGSARLRAPVSSPTTGGDATAPVAAATSVTARSFGAVLGVSVMALAALTTLAYLLPGSDIVHALARGIS